MICFITFHSQMDLIVVFKVLLWLSTFELIIEILPFLEYVRTTIVYFDNHIGFLKSTCFRKFNVVVNTSIWGFYRFHIPCCNRHLPLMFLVIPIWWMIDQVWVSNYMNKTYMWVFSYKFKGETKGMTNSLFAWLT
jgi:hypothetical protein